MKAFFLRLVNKTLKASTGLVDQLLKQYHKNIEIVRTVIKKDTHITHDKIEAVTLLSRGRVHGFIKKTNHYYCMIIIFFG